MDLVTNIVTKKKKRKYQVGWCTTFPGRVVERRENMIPGSGIIYQYHKCNSSTAENIQGIITLFHAKDIKLGTLKLMIHYKNSFFLSTVKKMICPKNLYVPSLCKIIIFAPLNKQSYLNKIYRRHFY